MDIWNHERAPVSMGLGTYGPTGGRNKQRIKAVAHGGQKLLMFGVGHSNVVVWNMKNDSYWLVLGT
jgi:hypothetical protein